MSLENSIKECCVGLNSIRSTERKKSAETLKDFLSRNAVPVLLSENTKKKTGYTWNEVFADIHDYIIKETEKFESSKIFDSVTGPLCANLLHLCVSGSNKGRAYIKCDNIMNACLFILKDIRLTKAVGDAYLNILYKHVLTCNHLLSYITPACWEELLEVCLTVCLSKHCKMDDFAKIRLLWLVMKNGKNCCQFIIPLKNSLSKLKKCFQAVMCEKKIQEIVIEIVTLLLETLSAESRLTICEFTENIFPSILKFYDQNLDQKKKSSLFKLLQLTIMLHHPQGVVQGQEGSLAFNWSVWNKQLNSFLEIVCLESAFLQKLRKQDDKLLKQCDNYYCLGASVYFQIFNLTLHTENAENGNTSKRQKTTCNNNKSFNDLVEELAQNNVPWLEITHKYIKNYGQTISIADYLTLLSVMESLIVNNTKTLNWIVLEDMASLSITNLKSHPDRTKYDYDAILLSLWNSCVRTSTLVNASHKALHKIMQLIITFGTLKYQNVQPLVKLYYENGMPMTDDSLKTLNHIFYKFFSKYSSFDDRMKCFTWLTHGQITSVDVVNVIQLLSRLLTSENISFPSIRSDVCEYDHLRDIIFHSVDKCILFSEFEVDVPKPTTNENDVENIILNEDVNNAIKEYFQVKLSEYNRKFKSQECQLLEYIKFISVVLAYADIKLKYSFVTRNQLREDEMFCLLKTALTLMFLTLSEHLKPDTPIKEQNMLLKCAQKIMMTEYDTLLNSTVRQCINVAFFKSVSNVINSEMSTDDGEYEGDDSEFNPNILRHNCICFLAAYCRKTEEHREEILELILDYKLYSFSISWDVETVFEIIVLLNQPEVQDPPIEPTFTLMQYMCKDLFRHSNESYKILKILVQMLDRIWVQDDNTRQNCFIMVKSYLLRCEQLYYPPHVAALVYECAAKIAILDIEHNREFDNNFIDTLINKVKGDIHSLRLFCCYLLKMKLIQLSDNEVERYIATLMEIFVIKVSEKKELILKDESANRTLTIMHNFYALAQVKCSFLHWIVTEVIQMQLKKSLDKCVIKKVLNKITNMITKQNIDVYLNDNILSILNFWFTQNNSLEQLPLHLFGFDHMDLFLEKHMRWLVAADTLWRKEGNVKESDVLKQILTKTTKTEQNIIEVSICNIIVLCLPYIVIGKYRLSYTGPGSSEWSGYAERMFRSSREILGDEKWSTQFAGNVSELILLTATHLSDHVDAQRLFEANIPQQNKSYYYPKEVYTAILRYIGELIDENIMQYLCENKPFAIFNTLFELWKNVLQENTYHIKVLSLHKFLTFIESIPLGHATDRFVCNFVCNSISQAIKDSQSKEMIGVLAKALKIVLERYLLEADVLRKSVSRILSILMIKKEEGFDVECASLVSYLTVDMKGHLKESEDVVDFISAISQGVTDSLRCASSIEFLERLETYKKSLWCPSHETLSNMCQFLKNNKLYVSKLCEELNTKGFSDDCGTSIIHQIIHSLSNVLKSSSDHTTTIETCNCLAEIGNYDLKTLVTVPPGNVQKITDVKPRQYFAIVVMKTLIDVLFDESPIVTNEVTKTLKRLLKFREGKDVMDLEEVDKQLLKPFSSSSCNTFAEFKINDVKFNSTFTATNWILRENEAHHQWLARLTVGLLDVLTTTTNFLSTLRPVCLLKTSVCRKVLPPLFGLLLECSSEQHIKIISEQMNHFFQHVWDLNFDHRFVNSGESDDRKNTSSALGQDHKIIIQYMLDIVDLVRLQRNHYKKRSNRTIETFNFLNLEYDKVAWAATVADQNLSAIFYGELWANAQNDAVPPSSPEATTQLPGGENLQRILRKCFVSIGEMDALDGCGTAHLTSEDEKRKHLINTGQFTDVMLLHDIALSYGGHVDHDLQYSTVKSLHKSGLYYLALQYIKSVPENDELIDIKYDCLSYLGDWTDFADTRNLEEKSKQENYKSHSIIKAFRYSCLKDCLTLQMTAPDFENKLTLPLNRAKLAVARLCQDLNMENCQSVYKVLSKLHTFIDIEDYFSVRCNKLSINELLGRWQVDRLPPFHDFKHLEMLISQRSLILQHAAKTYSNSLTDLVLLQLQYVELSLSNDRVQIAQRLLAVVKKLQTSAEVDMVDSEISWAKGHKDIALSLLRNIVSRPSSDVKLTAKSLRQYGLWMAESKGDNARDIINKYLKKSLEVLSRSDHQETRLKVYYDIAKFADAEYNQVIKYMNSSSFEKKVKCVEIMRDTACSLRSTQQSLNKDEKKALLTNERFWQIDEAEVASTRAEKETFLHLAMRYYLLSLIYGEQNNLCIFRVISLWLDNPNIELTDCEEGSFGDLLHAIPSWKYVTVLPQLGPRLTSDRSTFAENLRRIIERCAKEHPHHTLPIIFSLKNSEKDKILLNASVKVGGSKQKQRSVEPRVVAAQELIDRLAAENEVMAVIVAQMEKMCDATISLANYVPKSKEPKQKIPSAELIHRLGHLDFIPVPTVTIPLNQDCRYPNLPTLYAFESYFELVGGINCPKKIICKSSDGKSRILLIKGEDDLRQDAVMQQVFNIVNTLLETNPITSRNKLLIRTYKVVPMSRRSGVLEWCEGTMPIGAYLTGNSGAHVRYRPRDITANAARTILMALNGKRNSNHEKMLEFLKILKEFKPVFHYFFTEHYLDPVTWYERRLAYTKSVATSSMIGYILGLGDRHLQNILIDKKTAEVVHIDFGIAFDQGKTLPTPETIPFRLTQDIVAGFGSSGVEGVFRRCCEKTMQLLRDNQETLLTILEVLLCDPLYSWTVTSKQQNVAKAPSRDSTLNQTSGSDGSLAKRALLTVSSKLSGTEGGVAGGVAVPGQVARLIHTATDPANLCRLFHGWQAYL